MKTSTKIAIAAVVTLVAAPLFSAGSLLVTYKREMKAKERARDIYRYPVEIDGRAIRRENGERLKFDTQDAADRYAKAYAEDQAE